MRRTWDGEDVGRGGRGTGRTWDGEDVGRGGREVERAWLGFGGRGCAWMTMRECGVLDWRGGVWRAEVRRGVGGGHAWVGAWMDAEGYQGARMKAILKVFFFYLPS